MINHIKGIMSREIEDHANTLTQQFKLYAARKGWTVEDWLQLGYITEESLLHPNARKAKEIMDTPLYKAMK